MSTPSKFPSSAYLGAELLVLLLLLTHFQVQGQVSSAPEDSVIVLKKEKATYVHYPIYLDASLENFYLLWLGVNAGVFCKGTHFFTG